MRGGGTSNRALCCGGVAASPGWAKLSPPLMKHYLQRSFLVAGTALCECSRVLSVPLLLLHLSSTVACCGGAFKQLVESLLVWFLISILDGYKHPTAFIICSSTHLFLQAVTRQQTTENHTSNAKTSKSTYRMTCDGFYWMTVILSLGKKYMLSFFGLQLKHQCFIICAFILHN